MRPVWQGASCPPKVRKKKRTAVQGLIFLLGLLFSAHVSNAQTSILARLMKPLGTTSIEVTGINSWSEDTNTNNNMYMVGTYDDTASPSAKL